MDGGQYDSERALYQFYSATYPSLLGVVGAIAQDRDLAEDAVQDAFVRLIDQWPKVSHYADLEGWVRKVALGYLSKRRRKIRNGWHAALRYGLRPDEVSPSGDLVDLRRALATLPRTQREVIVLRELGLQMDEIADQLGVPVGTVKSRLFRARSTLSPLLQEEVVNRV